MKSVLVKQPPTWLPQPIVELFEGQWGKQMPVITGTGLHAIIADPQVWARLESARLLPGCEREWALRAFAMKATYTYSILSQHMPAISKAKAASSLAKIAKTARALRGQLRLLGPLAAPIRFMPRPIGGSRPRSQVMQNFEWHVRHHDAMTAANHPERSIDLEVLLSRAIKMAEAPDALLRDFDEIYSPQVAGANSRAATMARALLGVASSHFQEAVDDAIAGTVAAFYPGAHLTRQVRRRRTGK